MFEVSNLTTGLVITHIIVSILVIVFYNKISALKKMKLVQQYKNVVLWTVSGLVCSLILLDITDSVSLTGIGGSDKANHIKWSANNWVERTLLVATIVHLVVSIVLAIPFFYNMIISILPTKSYKNQILWCVSLVVCFIMGGAVGKLLKKSQPKEPTLTVTITGTVKNGEKLTAVPKLVNGPATPAYTYKWTRSDDASEIGKDAEYTLQPDDVDKTVSVTVSVVANGSTLNKTAQTTKVVNS